MIGLFLALVQLAEDVLRQTIADNSPVNSGAGSKAIFHSTADLVMGLSGLVAAAAQSGAALNVTGGHVWALSQTLLAWRHSQDVGVQGHLLAALPALCAHHHATAANTHGPSTLIAPVYVTLLSPSITLGEQDTVRHPSLHTSMPCSPCLLSSQHHAVYIGYVWP